jgi:hypothetical protein
MRRALAVAILIIAALSLACEQTKNKAGHDRRTESVHEGQEVKPFSPSELAEVRRRFKEVITLQDE